MTSDILIMFNVVYIGAFMYVNGSAATGSTYDANRKAFDKYRIIPRMLVNASTRNIEVSVYTPYVRGVSVPRSPTG